MRECERERECVADIASERKRARARERERERERARESARAQDCKRECMCVCARKKQRQRQRQRQSKGRGSETERVEASEREGGKTRARVRKVEHRAGAIHMAASPHGGLARCTYHGRAWSGTSSRRRLVEPTLARRSASGRTGGTRHARRQEGGVGVVLVTVLVREVVPRRGGLRVVQRPRAPAVRGGLGRAHRRRAPNLARGTIRRLDEAAAVLPDRGAGRQQRAAVEEPRRRRRPLPQHERRTQYPEEPHCRCVRASACARSEEERAGSGRS